MDWTAFTGITQFLATIATFAAIIVALYEIRRQYRTKISIIFKPHFPEKHELYFEMFITIQIINHSNHTIYIDDGYMYTNLPKSSRFMLNIPQKELKQGDSIEIDFNGREIYKPLGMRKHPKILCTINTCEQYSHTEKYKYSKTWFPMFDTMEEKNNLIEGYSEQKEKRSRAIESARQAAYDAYIEHADGSYFNKASKISVFLFRITQKLGHIVSVVLKWRVINSIILAIVFSTLLFFALLGLMSIL